LVDGCPRELPTEKHDCHEKDPRRPIWPFYPQRRTGPASTPAVDWSIFERGRSGVRKEEQAMAPQAADSVNTGAFKAKNRNLGPKELELFLACFANDAPSVERLLKGGFLSKPADIHTRANLNSTNNAKDLSLLRAAIDHADYPLVGLLLAKGAGISEGDLTVAVRLGKVDVIRLLIASGAAVTSTDFAAAVTSRRIDVLRLIIDSGVRVDAGTRADTLVHTIRRGDLDMMKFLIAVGADVNARTPSGAIPLACASLDQKEIVAYLLDRGADVNVHNGCVLFEAIKYKNTSMVEFLLARGARVDCVDAEGRTPMARALEQAAQEIVDLLASAGVPRVPECGEGQHDFGKPRDVDDQQHRWICRTCGHQQTGEHQWKTDFCNDFPYCNDGCRDNRFCSVCKAFRR
jgi:hypothetical protein